MQKIQDIFEKKSLHRFKKTWLKFSFSVLNELPIAMMATQRTFGPATA
jgi:hypothetical protein